MPIDKENENPIKLRVHVSKQLHQQLIQLCGLQTLEEGRLVTMSELLRDLLEEGVSRELCQSHNSKPIASTSADTVSTEGGAI